MQETSVEALGGCVTGHSLAGEEKEEENVGSRQETRQLGR